MYVLVFKEQVFELVMGAHSFGNQFLTLNLAHIEL